MKSKAQGTDPNVDGYRDRILEFPNSNPNVTDRNSDSQIDVRDLVLYINGLPLEAWFSSAESSALSYGIAPTVQVQFTRPVTGIFAYDMGGNAVSNKDFQALSGQLNLNNAASALIPVQVIPSTSLRGPRSIVLTLKSPATNLVSRIPATPSEGKPLQNRFSTHVMTIRDADQGLYSGNLSFLSETTRTIVTNGPTITTNVFINPAPAIAPSSLLMALRSDAPGQKAIIEMPECILFTTNRLAMPVNLLGNASGFTSPSPVVGATTLSQLNSRAIAWTFQFTSATFTNNGQQLDAECLITLTGLTVSGVPTAIKGTVSATRLDP